MPDVTITALGLAAVRISDGSQTVYADAFFKEHPIRPFDARDADVILVTHDHRDHYDAAAVAAAARATGAVVIGPPSIAHAMLVQHALPAEQVRILHHQDPGTPVRSEVGATAVSAFASPHFCDGDQLTIHNSYLVELGGKRIFLTGDSCALTRKEPRLQRLDALVYNFVTFDRDLAKVAALEEVERTFAPRRLIPVHVLDCGWTLAPGELAREVARRRLASVVVIEERQGSCVV